MNKDTENAIKSALVLVANDKLKEYMASDSAQEAMRQGVNKGLRAVLKPMLRKALKPYVAIFNEARDISKNHLINEMSESEVEIIDFEAFYEETILVFRQLVEVAENKLESEDER